MLFDLCLLMQQMEWICILSARVPLRLLLENIWSHLAHSEDLVAVFEVVQLRNIVV